MRASKKDMLRILVRVIFDEKSFIFYEKEIRLPIVPFFGMSILFQSSEPPYKGWFLRLSEAQTDIIGYPDQPFLTVEHALSSTDELLISENEMRGFGFKKF